MKIKTHLVVTNIDCELTFHQFQTEQEAKDKAWAIVKSLFEEGDERDSFDDFVSENDDDLNTCWVSATGGNHDTLNVEEVEIEVPRVSELDSRELGTVLAALRYWQRQGCPDGPELREIASDNDMKPLDLEEIDALCERLNLGQHRQPATKAQIEAARAEYQSDDVNIDDDAATSDAVDDGGTWVQAWVWLATAERSTK